MTATCAQGVCKCGLFARAIGADERDAHMLLNHEHGHATHHVFEGEVAYSETKETKRDKPKR